MYVTIYIYTYIEGVVNITKSFASTTTNCPKLALLIIMYFMKHYKCI